jgi:hypothetical protein
VAFQSLPATFPLSESLDRFDKERRDNLVSTIARRMASNRAIRERRHTATHLRKLAWPVYMNGRNCYACITIHWLLDHPREHQRETFYYLDLAEARSAHPTAVMLPDADGVLERLKK